jgi:NCS2 family nucleobase:cation symporter-2
MSPINGVKDDHPDRIGPNTTPRQTFGDKARGFAKAFTTKDGLIGDYGELQDTKRVERERRANTCTRKCEDYAFLFTPSIPFMKKTKRAAPFFGLNEKMPVFLALLLGFQHSLSMLAGT